MFSYRFLRIFYTTRLSLNKDSFTFFSPVFISLFAYFTRKDSNEILNRRVRDEILTLFLILEKVFSLSPLNIWLSVDFFYRFHLPSWKSSFLFIIFVIFLNHERVLNFVKLFFCIYWNGYIIFPLCSVNVVNYIDWSLTVKRIFHSWDKPQFGNGALCVFLNLLLDLIC